MRPRSVGAWLLSLAAALVFHGGGAARSDIQELGWLEKGEDGPSVQPRIVALYDNAFFKYFEQWKVCARRALGAAGYEERVQAVNLTEAEETAGAASSLLQVDVAPPSVQVLLPKLLRDHVARGEDIMHLDADAFLMKDPKEAFSERFPEVDLVASADCAHVKGTCAWYVAESFLARHGGQDPLAERGFMLNIGAMLFRGNPRVQGLLDELIATRRAVGETWGDQTLLNEVLEQWRCSWTWSDGARAEAEETFAELVRRPAQSYLKGTCTGGGAAEHTGRQREALSVVVLPWSVVTRYVTSEGVVAFHPGAVAKDRALELARSVCV